LFAGACQKVAGQMKNAIREYLYPHVPERLALDETHQMNLVQQDAVKEMRGCRQPFAAAMSPIADHRHEQSRKSSFR